MPASDGRRPRRRGSRTGCGRATTPRIATPPAATRPARTRACARCARALARRSASPTPAVPRARPRAADSRRRRETSPPARQTARRSMMPKPRTRSGVRPRRHPAPAGNPCPLRVALAPSHRPPCGRSRQPARRTTGRRRSETVSRDRASTPRPARRRPMPARTTTLRTATPRRAGRSRRAAQSTWCCSARRAPQRSVHRSLIGHAAGAADDQHDVAAGREVAGASVFAIEHDESIGHELHRVLLIRVDCVRDDGARSWPARIARQIDAVALRMRQIFRIE